MRLPPARATFAIGAITALAWAVVAAGNLTDAVLPLASFIPARVSTTLVIPGALPVALTPLSATLIHAGILHLGFNLLIFVFCGRLVEASIGPAGLVILYIIGAYAAAAAQYLAGPHSMVPIIGASGASSAVIGAYALLYGQRRVRAWGPISGRIVNILWLAAAWIGLQLLLGFASAGVPGVPPGSTIAVAEHIGGFLAGLALARPLLLLRYRSA